jgi:hypothetical protein
MYDLVPKTVDNIIIVNNRFNEGKNFLYATEGIWQPRRLIRARGPPELRYDERLLGLVPDHLFRGLRH